MKERRGRRRSEAADESRMDSRVSSDIDASNCRQDDSVSTEEHDTESKTYKSLYNRVPCCPTPPTKDCILTRGLLIAQFASPDGKSLADAVELISAIPEQDEEGAGEAAGERLVDGIDLNCVRNFSFYSGHTFTKDDRLHGDPGMSSAVGIF
jgi:hypothetical protein